jgi:hypothetical protein
MALIEHHQAPEVLESKPGGVQPCQGRQGFPGQTQRSWYPCEPPVAGPVWFCLPGVCSGWLRLNSGQQVSKLVQMAQAFNHHAAMILENRKDIYRFSKKYLVSQPK